LRNFYDMLSVAPNAPPDEIKKAFRREIARYHPDKVQHLGQEFQEMASGIAADLTEAYRILMDPALRARYDETLGGATTSGVHSAPPPRPDPGDSVPQPEPSSSSSSSSAASSSSASASSWSSAAPPRPSSTAGFDFVRKASLSRMREALEDVMGNAESGHVSGFDLALLSKPKRGLFKKADDRVRLLVKVVPTVDADTIVDVWTAAMKGKVADAILCVLLCATAIAPAKDLSTAISEQRRKTRTGGPVVVPVDVRDWEALFPPDTPATVRALIQRLKEEKR
jgi:curved DNA-binding protein CbpA